MIYQSSIVFSNHGFKNRIKLANLIGNQNLNLSSKSHKNRWFNQKLDLFSVIWLFLFLKPSS